MIVSLVVNLSAFDWRDSLVAAAVLIVTCSGIVWNRHRTSVAQRQWLHESALLKGLKNCPISNNQLCDLFNYLNRPNPPECSRRLRETHEYLKTRSLPIERTLKWLNANGAGCDCEVIMNTAQAYGPGVGFEWHEEDDAG